MLSTPKYTRTRMETLMADSREVMNIRQASQYLGVSPDTLYKYVNEQKLPAFKLGNRWRFRSENVNGRLARSDEHSPSFAVSGSESGHALQVRERAKASGVQIGQPLALQKIEARSVDGREVDGNGTAGQKENQGSRESCRNSVNELGK